MISYVLYLVGLFCDYGTIPIVLTRVDLGIVQCDIKSLRLGVLILNIVERD